MMEIQNFCPCDKGSAIATFDVFAPKMQMTFRNIKLILTKKGHHFVSFPSFVVGESFSDKKTYEKYYFFHGDLQKQFEAEILKLLEPYLK